MKYGNKPTDYGSVRYASAKEARFAAELDLLARAGELKWWRRQEREPLKVNGKLICTIVVDFLVCWSNGEMEWIEVKGQETRDWQIKWKLFDALYPERSKRVVK